MLDSDIFLTGDAEKDTRRVTYFIFITGVSLLSLAVALLYYIVPDPEIKQVLSVLDTVYAFIFLFDFYLRVRHVSDRKHYLTHWGWVDFLTSIPGLPALRIIRSIGVIISARKLFAVTPDEIEDAAKERVAESVLFLMVFVGLLVLTVGSMAIVVVEADATGTEIKTGYDAVWWSLVTVSTVGYGDEFPVTNMGRIIGVFMIVVGVALFTTLTSYLASSFTDRGASRQRAEQLEVAKQNAIKLEGIMERMLKLEEAIAGKLGVELPQDEEEDS